MIDHINRDPSDNRISNLREATSAQNQANQKIKSRTGFSGVFEHKGKTSITWQARIGTGNRRVYLGSYKSKYDAIIARKQAERRYFGEFRPL
jgi:hypothetical protein